MKTSPKKIAFWLSLAVSLLVLTIIIISAVARDDTPEQDDEESTYVPETIEYDDELSAPIYEGMPEGVSYRRITARTVTDVETASRVVINYPLFDGFGGDETDQAINELISYHNSEMKRQYGNGMDKMLGRYIKVVYEVSDFYITYIDSDFISIMYEGVFAVSSEKNHIDMGNSYFKYSINIDVKNKRMITSDDIISNFNTLKLTFQKGAMDLEWGVEGLRDSISYYEMFSQYTDTYDIYPMLYFTREKLMMIISLTPDLGGNAVFSYNIKDSEGFIDHSIPAMQKYYS